MLIWMVHIWTNKLFNILVDYITYWVLNCTISLSVVSFDELTPSSDPNLNKPDTVYTKISKYNMKSFFKFCFFIIYYKIFLKYKTFSMTFYSNCVLVSLKLIFATYSDLN